MANYHGILMCSLVCLCVCIPRQIEMLMFQYCWLNITKLLEKSKATTRLISHRIVNPFCHSTHSLFPSFVFNFVLFAFSDFVMANEKIRSLEVFENRFILYALLVLLLLLLLLCVFSIVHVSLSGKIVVA